MAEQAFLRADYWPVLSLQLSDAALGKHSLPAVYSKSLAALRLVSNHSIGGVEICEINILADIEHEIRSYIFLKVC